VEYFISYFTKAEGWVFDPFMGVGSTAAACLTLHRNCIGTELNETYWQYSFQRIQESLQNPIENGSKVSPMPKNTSNQDASVVIEDGINRTQYYLFHSDARQGPQLFQKKKLPAIDFLITSPPYWNMLKKSRGGVKSNQKQRSEEGLDTIYSNNPSDYGNIDDYETYLKNLVDLFASFKPCLKPNAYLMVILQNCRPPDGDMQPLAWDFARLMREFYHLKQEFIWCQDQKFLGIWGWPTTYVSNVHHHYCLVFQNK
jgi:DNA modification methylase